ncbi:hypothetical protein FSARC_4706 [Fusarium sarcochroum]|uniref:USP domain-containing protein n=1 Tax=Fusarium sarcochroum TaxID=1208366 RepID=A0A8H4U164_9HYPO|nr:hypothetical protein FSARC_4706 [Fusarium sarcochroum]
MDPASRSPDLLDRAVSAEASSTRPNPFDDGDISARKRRRTSLSGSPTTSLDTVNPIHDSSSSTTLDTDPVLLRPGSAAESPSDPVAPKTPEPGSPMCDPPTEPPSSMVTLNLRNAPQNDSSSSPPSPSPVAQPAAAENRTDAANDQIKESVEDSEVEMVPAPPQSVDTPRSSLSRSASPPIEVITVQSDDDMISDRQSVGVSIVGDDPILIDPIRDFPFREPDETLEGMATRLTNYLSNRKAYHSSPIKPKMLNNAESPIEATVLHKLQQWLEQYLEYARNVDHQSGTDSCRLNFSFWMAFPNIVSAMAYHRPPLFEEETLREVTGAFFVGFSRLAAWFVTLDLLTIKKLVVEQTAQGRRPPDLLSPNYLQHLHSITQPQFNSDRTSYTELTSSHLGDASHFIKVYQDSPGGSLSRLLQLTKGLVDFVPAFPRLTNDLGPICQIASDIMADAVFSLNLSDIAPKAKQRLEVGHVLHNLAYETLDRMIEKRPTQLIADNVANSVRAFTSMIKTSLRGDHEAATRLLQEHQAAFPEIPADYTIDSIAWEQRLQILIKLIRSSQMQLRVLGVTSMCQELVQFWRRHSENGDGSSAHVGHIADYLLQTGLIEYILGSNCHPEITLEGANIVGFIIVTKKYRKEHIDMVWQGITSGQDPRTADALTRMVANIVNLFDYQGLLIFCEKFQALPVDNFTTAARILWENIMVNMVSRSSMNQQTLSFHPYNLCLRLLRESSVCTSGSQVTHPDLQKAAMQKLKDLLSYGPDREGRRQLYLSCLEDIANKSITTLGSLWCLSITIRSAMVGELHLLVEEHDLTRLIVEELEHAVEAGRAVEAQMVLCSPINHPRREFITNLIQMEPQTITKDLGVKLWDMLVGPLSLSLEDRRAGWGILNNLNRRINVVNPFLQTCLSHYLPDLSSEYFCEGMLEFLRAEILPRLNEKSDLALDDQDAVAESGIEQLWRLVLEADDGALVERSIRTLAVDVYIENRYIASNPVQRTRSIHLALVGRCLQQLKDAAKTIKTSGQNTASGDDEAMVVVATEQQMQQQERIFTRSLKLLRYVLEAHQTKPLLSAPDLGTLIPQATHEVQGDSAELKYQSFDGDQQTDIKPLVIGKRNTAASLLASLRQETGFENYRVYYRGRPFLPTEQEICKSLEDLCVHDGLILVRREEAGPALSNGVKPGASPLEIEISAHFDEMWEYLSMEETLAQEIYYFLVKLPTDGHLAKLIDNETASYKDVFPSGQPFKSLYAVHALVEYTETSFPGRVTSDHDPDNAPNDEGAHFAPYPRTLRTSMSFIVQAISDENIFDRASVSLRLRLTCALLHAFRRFLDRIDTPRGSAASKNLVMPEPARLVEILSYAAKCTGEAPSPAVAGTLAICLRLSMLDDQFWTKLSTNPDFGSILECLMLTDPRHTIRSLASKLIEELFSAMDHTVSTDEATSGVSDRPRDSPLAQYFWTITIVSSGVEDSYAKGISSLLHLCLQLDNSVARSETLPDDLAMSLLWRQLYPTKREQSGQPVPRVVLNGETRAKLCDVVFNLVKHNKDKMKAVLEALNEQVPFWDDDDDGMSCAASTSQSLTADPDEPYLYELSYQFEPLKALRAPCGYVGLQNLSNTCYLNSLLTQLYMNTGFRRFVLNSRIRDPANSQQLLFYTQKLFGYMQESYRRFIDPSNFVNSIKTYDDTLIDIHNQMDVDEFYNLLFDRWEGQLLGHDEKRKMKSFYSGQIVQQVKSKECEHISERLEPFSAIQCDIKGKNTLADSLQAYVDGEIMEGDNKYKCSTCDRHVDAVKRACLKDIPNNVIFHLKRFDFNLRTLQRSKINDYFSFPSRIDMRPYTIEHLSNPENDTGEDIFELVGVLVHSGTAESGHYYSYIRERPSSADRPTWVEFNDDMVTQWDPSYMENSTFGGPDHRPLYDTNGVVYDKTYSAYMLFYQRASSLRAEQEEMTSLGVPAPLRVPLSDDLEDHILGENTVLLRRHCIYDQSNIRLVQRLFHQSQRHCSNPDEINDPNQSINVFMARHQQEHGLQDLAMQTLVSHMDQVITRARDIPDFLSFSKTIADAITSCHDCAFSFYHYFSRRRDALRALLQRNPDPGVRSFISKSFIAAVKKVTDLPNVYDPQILDSPVSDPDGDENLALAVSHCSVIDDVMALFGHLWKFFHIHIRAWDEYFAAVLNFARFGNREVGYVLAADYLAKTLKMISADPLQELTGNWARMLHSVIRRTNNTKPPSYLSIIALAHYLLERLEPVIGPEVIDDEPTERLARMVVPFSWTSNEVNLIYQDLNGSDTSLFVEKLLALDQAQGHCDRIIRLLAGMGDAMDRRILETLKQCIRGETSTQAMDPFLRAASAYIESTELLNNATAMVHHIFLQTKSLQNTEGVYFLRFFATALNLKQQDKEFTKSVRSFSLDRVPKWVPFLVAYPDQIVRTNTELFLDRQLLEVLAETTPSDGDGSWSDHEDIKQTVKQIGLACLEYLQEHHVRKRAYLSRDIADKFLGLIAQCAEAVDMDPDTQSELDTEFLAMQDADVVDPFRRLIVDEMEEDGSGNERAKRCGTDVMIESMDSWDLEETMREA